MGTLLALPRRPLHSPEVYAPVNYRPPDKCRTMFFDPSDGNHYEDRFDAVGIQYALDEEGPDGYYVVETPTSEGPLIRWVHLLPDNMISVMECRHGRCCQLRPRDEVNVLGRVFQFIRPFDTDERWELIRGPAYSGTGESLTIERAV